jgi:hypothetical protein
LREEEEKKKETEEPSFSTRVAQASPTSRAPNTLDTLVLLLHISSLYSSTFQTYFHIYIMSFLFGGAPKMSSAEKIAAAETEVEMISDMFNR